MDEVVVSVLGPGGHRLEDEGAVYVPMPGPHCLPPRPALLDDRVLFPNRQPLSGVLLERSRGLHGSISIL